MVVAVVYCGFNFYFGFVFFLFLSFWSVLFCSFLSFAVGLFTVDQLSDERKGLFKKQLTSTVLIILMLEKYIRIKLLVTLNYFKNCAIHIVFSCYIVLVQVH